MLWNPMAPKVREDHMSERLALGSPVDGLLDRLYERHVAQDDAVAAYFTARAADGSLVGISSTSGPAIPE